MEKLELGKSYDAEELAKICGREEDIRYETYVFEGDKAKVIAQDEGNGVVKVLEIIRQTPVCPACGKEINTIYTSRTVQLKYKEGAWGETQEDRYYTYGCPECGEEFSRKELDLLGVPNEIR